MPSTNKRINLTVPDELYKRLKSYMAENGFTSDATACLQLITKQLKGEERMQAMLNLIQNTNLETLQQLSTEGYELLKQLPNPKDKR